MAKKFDSFADIAKLEEEQQKVLSLFKEIENGIDKLGGLGVKLNSAKTIQNVTSATAQYEAAFKEVLKLQKTYSDQEAKLQILRSKEYEQTVQQKIAISEQRKEIELRIKLRNAEEGSLEQMNLKLQKASKIYAQLNDEQKKSARGQQFADSIRKLSDAINDQQKKIGNFRNNVGRYAESLSDQFELVRREIQKLQKEQEQLNNRGDTEGAARVRGNIEDLNKVMKISLDTTGNYKNVTRQLEQAYIDLSKSGGQSNDFLREFAKLTADSKRETENLRKDIKALSSETRGLDLMTSAISSLASGFEIAAGASALFGRESDDTQRTLQKLIAIQSVANGVRELGKQITDRTTAAGKAYNFVLENFNIAIAKGSTGSQRFFSILKLGVAGLAVAGLFALVDAIVNVGDKSEKAKDQIKFFNDQIERIAEVSAKSIEQLKFVQNIGIEKLKQRGATEAEINEQSVSNIKDQAKEWRKLGEDQLKYLSQATGLNLTELNTLGQVTKAVEKLKDEKLRLQGVDVAISDKGISKTLKKQIEVVEGYIKIGEAVEKNFQTATELDQQATIQSLQFTTAANEKKREILLKAIAEEKKAKLDLFVFNKELEIKHQQLISDLKITPEASINAEKKIADLKKQILAEQAKYEIGLIEASQAEQSRKGELTAIQEQANADKILLIKKKSSQDQLNVDYDYLAKSIEIRTNYRQQIIEQAEADAAALKNAEDKDREDRIANAEKNFNDEQLRASIFRNERLKFLNDQLKDGVLSTQQYNDKKKEIENDYQHSILQSQVGFYKHQIDILKSFGLDTTLLEKSLYDTLIQLDNNYVENKKENTDRIKELNKQIEETTIDTIQIIVGVEQDLISGIFDARKNKIQEQIDDIDRWKEAEINRINATSEAEEKKAARIKIVEAKAAADKEALERKQRQIARQQAIAERAFKAFQIVTDNIQAVNKIKAELFAAIPIMKPYWTSQLVLQIASGAASLVSLLATPIPKFWKGTDYSPEGMAEVAEKGAEMGVDQSGKLTLYKEHQITYLNKGTKIYNADVTKNILNSLSISGSRSVKQQPGESNKEIVDQLKELNKKKSGINIYNSPAIETTAWFDKHIRG